ncbi:sortase [Patescibacteria group bacterium]
MLKKIFEFIRFIFIFLLFFVLIYGALNYPALSNYISHTQEKGEHIVNLHNKNIFTEEEAKTVPKSSENHLVVPTLHIDVPIVWESKESDILNKLKDGVVRFPKTALPGQVGNIFIVGHSSNWWWDSGEYNSIFAALSKLKKNDEILIYYKDQQYIYQVIESKVVMPDQTEVLESTNKSILSLMTCTPVGTSWKRLVVTAKQIWPESDTNKIKDNLNPSADNLPSIR